MRCDEAKAIIVRRSVLNSPAIVAPMAIVALVAIPREVSSSYVVFGTVFAIGLAAIFLRGDWQKASGLDKLVLLGPIFYAAPLAAFGTEHFTLPAVIASLVPRWIPWHLFWTYFVGAGFIAAAVSLVTRIQARLAASLLALTFFLFVVLMDAPGWMRQPGNRIALALTLRELAFSGGSLALAARLSEESRGSGAPVLATLGTTMARYFVAIPVLFYSVLQFLHGDHVPGVPLERMTPEYVPMRMIWTYLVAVVYAAAGVPLLLDKKTRAAAAWIGLATLVAELAVYVPIAVVERASLDGFNYMADTLMFCGAVLLLAGAMPREA